jgi:copper chaperone CopZ
LGFSAFSQDNQKELKKGEAEIKIKTSAQCEECKERIEKNMAFEKGVKAVNLNLEDKVLTVTYKSNKTTPQKLREALSEIGYDADDVAADPKAYAKLPACCQKGGHDH